ncbi:MAG: sensor histidine kinase [Chitinophagaceae bacterium]
MVAFIVFIMVNYRKKQHLFQQSIENLKLDNEKALLNTQLEIQEQTFQHISREIHDNIGLLLTLAKLNLNTLEWGNDQNSKEKMESTIELLTSSIAQLSDISKSLNADIIKRHGLLEAIDEEMKRIRKTGLFKLDLSVSGTPVYMESRRELLLFRIIQEAFNNIIKHAGASFAGLYLHYLPDKLVVSISDNGRGFHHQSISKNQAGLQNMETRTRVLQGDMEISSRPETGTTLTFKIPLE